MILSTFLGQYRDIMIPEAIWRIWEGINFPAKLGGIYANKPGYHNSVNANKLYWPGNYSIRVPEDLKGDFTKARALDLTMSTSEMIKRTTLLKEATERNDPRLAAVREFYGTLDGKRVYGRIKDSLNGKWRNSTADSSHLWHLHISFFTSQATSKKAAYKVLEVLNGGESMFCKKGDRGSNVEFLQRFLYRLGFDPAYDPKDNRIKPEMRFDGIYGDAVAHALLTATRTINKEIKQGDNFTPKAYLVLQELLIRKVVEDLPDQWEEKLITRLHEYIENNPPTIGYVKFYRDNEGF